MILPYISDKYIISKKIMKYYLQGFNDSCQELQICTVDCISLFIDYLPLNEVNNKFIPFICHFLNSELNLQILKAFTAQLKIVFLINS